MVQTCVTDTSVVYLDANLVGLGRGNFDVLDGEGLGGTPGDGGLFGRSSASMDGSAYPEDQGKLTLQVMG